MQCDQCGREIRSGEDSLSTTVEKLDYRVSANPGVSRITPLTLCDSCAAQRRATQRWFFWALLLGACTLIVVCLLTGIAHQ